MIKIDYRDLNPLALCKRLADCNASIILIESFPEDTLILEGFVKKLGAPIQENCNLQHDITYEVTVDKKNKLFTSYANTNYYFPLHTDCSDFEEIPEGIAMYCSIPAEEGGESYYVAIDDVVTQFSDKELSILLEKEWEFRNQKRPILRKMESGYTVCYNRIMMESFTELTEKELLFLDRFDEVVRKESHVYSLKANDLLLLRNDKYLHGRNEFSENSNRLIKRIRFKLQTLHT